MSEDAEKLKPPATKYGYIESPKAILAYLKAGCEIRQIGRDRRCSDDITEYWIVAPGMAWEARLHEVHVKALETLELVRVDSCSGNTWFSRENFSIPTITDGVVSACP